MSETSDQDQRLRVVVAEDESLIRLDLVEMLDAGGYDVVAAVSDGEAAVAAIAEHRPDLALLDEAADCIERTTSLGHVIVDEAQSLERNVLLTVLSRMGQNSRVVLTHDVAQRDNLRVGRHDGIAAVVEKLKGHALFGHVTLTRSERSPIAALVTSVLAN